MTRTARAVLIFAAVSLLAGCTRPIPAPTSAAAPSPVPPGAFSFEGALVQGGMAIGQAPADAVAVSLDGQDLPLSADRRFVVGFDRDAGPEARVVARFADGSSLTHKLAIADRDFPVEIIPGLKRRPSLSPEYQRLRAQELARIGAARARAHDSDGWRQHWLWPVNGRITGVFGSQRILGGEPSDPHGGVDIGGDTGTAIVAPADGIVALASPPAFSLEGNLLIIDHGMGVNSAFLHMSRIDVREGEAVRRGQILGAVGATGRATGPHLHWGVKWRDIRIDPALITGPML